MLRNSLRLPCILWMATWHGAPWLFHVGDNLGLRSTLCTLCTTLGSPSKWHVHWASAWAIMGIMLVLAWTPHLAPFSPGKHGWGQFSFLLQKKCVLVAQELGWWSCQIPCDSGRLPGTSAWQCLRHAEWEEEVVCREHPLLLVQRGRGSVLPTAHLHTLIRAAWRSGGCSQECSLKWIDNPCFCWLPLLGKTHSGGCWMNRRSGTALGCICCVSDHSSSGCSSVILQPVLSTASCSCGKQKLFLLRTVVFCHPKIHISSRITCAALAAALPGPSREALLAQSLLLLLDTVNWRDLLETGSPVSSFLWTCLDAFVSAEMQVPFKAIFHERGIQNIPLCSGLLSV